jgi:hypothetical protein
MKELIAQKTAESLLNSPDKTVAQAARIVQAYGLEVTHKHVRRLMAEINAAFAVEREVEEAALKARKAERKAEIAALKLAGKWPEKRASKPAGPPMPPKPYRLRRLGWKPTYPH